MNWVHPPTDVSIKLLVFASIRYMFKFISSTILAALLAYILISPSSHIIEMPAGSSISRSLAKKVLAVETPEGAGALVRRSIGSAGLKNLTPFLMLDHFHVAKGAVINVHALLIL